MMTQFQVRNIEYHQQALLEVSWQQGKLLSGKVHRTWPRVVPEWVML
jgi:hypothetical protein